MTLSSDQKEPGQGEGIAPSRSRRWLQLAVIDVRPVRRHREFRLLLIGQGVSFLGGRIRDVAIPFQVYQLTHSSLAVGLILLLEVVPILFLAFLGGALADAHDRRRLVLLSEVAFAVMSLVLLVNATLPQPQIWLIFVVIAVMGGLDALQRPSLDAMLPRLVDREELTAAGAVKSFSTTAGMIVGPAIGGTLVALIGLPGTYGVDIASFFVSLVALSLMRAMPPPADAERPSLRRIVEGLRYARSRPELMGTYLVDMVAMFFGMPMALFPAIASQYGGAGVLGLLYSAPAVGAFLATATSGWTNHVHRHGSAVILAAGIWGAGITGFGISTWLPLGLFFLAVAGGADMVSGIFRSRIWNQTIPDSLRGRLAGIELISYTSGPGLSGVESGLVASIFNVRISLISGGILCMAGTALMALAIPAFWWYDSRRPSGTGG
jgi:MFS family permease